jgi:hypothetical protein
LQESYGVVVMLLKNLDILSAENIGAVYPFKVNG